MSIVIISLFSLASILLLIGFYKKIKASLDERNEQLKCLQEESTVLNLHTYFTSKEFREKTFDKLKENLDIIAKQEGVYVRMHENVDELNDSVFGPNLPASERASGAYSHPQNWEVTIRNLEYVKEKQKLIIDLHKQGSPLTYAHELGHHFGFIKDNNCTEEFANGWAVEYIKSIFTEEELIAISIDIDYHFNLEKQDSYFDNNFNKLINLYRANPEKYNDLLKRTSA